MTTVRKNWTTVPVHAPGEEMFAPDAFDAMIGARLPLRIGPLVCGECEVMGALVMPLGKIAAVTIRFDDCDSITAPEQTLPPPPPPPLVAIEDEEWLRQKLAIGR